MFGVVLIRVLSCALLLVYLGCASTVLDDDRSQGIKANKEFDDLVKIKSNTSVDKIKEKLKNEVVNKEKAISKTTQNEKKRDGKNKLHSKKLKQKIKAKMDSKKRKKKNNMNKLDSESKENEGLELAASTNQPPGKENLSRRPEHDPFVVGEKITLGISYFNVSAGNMTLEVLPFDEVNGRQSYHFKAAIKTSRLFAVVYTVDDWAETHVDFLTMTPSSMGIHIKESGQLKEVRTFFDWQQNIGKYWETKLTKKYGEEKKRKTWDIEPYSQNVISAIFHFRTFPLRLNDEIEFKVGDAGKNIVVKAKVIRQEVLDTDIGKLKTVVVKPIFTISGVFKPVGDIFFWFTDDRQHSLVRIESKIKIGTIVGQVKSIK